MKLKPLSRLIRSVAKYFWAYGSQDSWRAIYSLLERSDGCTLLDLDCENGE